MSVDLDRMWRRKLATWLRRQLPCTAAMALMLASPATGIAQSAGTGSAGTGATGTESAGASVAATGDQPTLHKLGVSKQDHRVRVDSRAWPWSSLGRINRVIGG